MATGTAIIVLAIWAGIGAIFYERPPCQQYEQTTTSPYERD